MAEIRECVCAWASFGVFVCCQEKKIIETFAAIKAMYRMFNPKALYSHTRCRFSGCVWADNMSREKTFFSVLFFSLPLYNFCPLFSVHNIYLKTTSLRHQNQMLPHGNHCSALACESWLTLWTPRWLLSYNRAKGIEKLRQQSDESDGARKVTFSRDIFFTVSRTTHAINNVSNLITTVKYNNSNTTQRFYDIFINNLCLIEVTFVGLKSQWTFFSSILSFSFRTGSTIACEIFSLEVSLEGKILESEFRGFVCNDFLVEHGKSVNGGKIETSSRVFSVIIIVKVGDDNDGQMNSIILKRYLRNLNLLHSWTIFKIFFHFAFIWYQIVLTRWANSV